MPSIESRSSTLTRVLVTALLVVPALVTLTAAPVAAQTEDTRPDVYVKDLRFGGEVVVGKPVEVTAVLGNKGAQPFGGTATPYRVCFTWNLSIAQSKGSTDRGPYCEAQGMDSSHSLNQWQTLHQQRNEESSRLGQTTIEPNGEASFTITWRPSENRPESGPQAGAGLIWVQVSYSNDIPGLRDKDDANNVMSFPVTVQRIETGLRPLWRDFLPLDEIREPCPTYASGLPAPGNCRVQPGDVLRLEIEVQNKGNREDRFTLYQYATKPEANESDMGCKNGTCLWNVSFPSSSVLVPAFGKRVVNVTLQVPRTGDLAGAEHDINGVGASASAAIRIRAVSLTDSAKTADTYLPRLVVDQLYRVNMTTWEPVRVGNVSSKIQFNFSVGNPGNGDDHYGIEFVKSKSTVNDTHWHLDTAIEQLERFEVRRFTNDTKGLTFRVPANASKGFHDVTLRVFSHGDPRQSTVADLSFRVYVMQHYALADNLERSSVAERPAETVLYPLEITNNGNGLDNVELRIEERLVPPQWSVLLEGRQTSILEVPVPANETRVVNLTVTSPAGEREGRVAFVNLTATSSGPEKTPRELRPRVEFETRTDVLRAPNFLAEAGARQLTGIFIDPNGTLAFDVNVRNVGNLWDNITLAPRDTPLGWKVEVSKTLLDLAPPGRFIQHPTHDTSIVRVTAPRTAEVGEEAVITLVATSEVDPSLSRTIKFGFRVSGPDLAITGLAVSKQHVYAGDPVNVTVTVANTGNKQPGTDPVLRVLYANGGTERIVTERSLADLTGGASRAVTVPWDTQGLAGAGTLIARIDPNNDIVEITESDNERLLSGDQTFIRLFDVQLDAAKGLTARAGERVLYEEEPNAFVLRNQGNKPEPVTITIRSQSGWFEPITRAVTVNPGDEKVIGFTFDVPELPGSAEDTIVMDVVPDYRPGSPLSAVVRTRLADDAPPVISDVKVTPSAPTVATPVTVSAKVTDALGVKHVTAFLRTPLNDTTTITLEKEDGSHVWKAATPFTVAGEYRLYVEAVDVSAGENRADTRGSLLVFEVTPGSAPTIEPVTDLSKPIRSGTPLRFAVKDEALSIARVYYVLGNEQYETPLSGTIDTTDWSPGKVTFTLVAENTYGVTTRKDFTVEVDNTPPSLTKVELDPASPKQGEPVTIKVTVDPSVEAVEVVIKRDGEVVDRLDAQKRGPGRFEVKYTPAAGKFSVDAIAKDAAGNTQSLESSVVFSTTGLLTPAPGAVAVVLVALGLAGLGARRRRG